MILSLPPVHPDVRFGFTTRRGGSSVGPLSTMNLARRPGETDEHLVSNWSRVTEALGLPPQLALVHQVHGAGVIEVTEASGPLAVLGKADAMVTTARGITLAVRTADCVPVVLECEGAIGAAHAGWRGVAAGVLEATVEALRGLGSGTLHAVIGPCISLDAYEVGEEVVEGICGAGVPEHVFVRRGTRAHVDVAAAAHHQLVELGCEVRHVRRCTFREPELFYSHRRDSDSGRQAGVIGRL